MRSVFASLMLILVCSLAPAQDKAKEPPPAPVKVVALARKEPVDFDKDVRPILVKRCLVCHSGSVTEGGSI